MSDLSASPAPVAFDRTRDLPRLEEIAGELAAVEAALARLDDGSYGRCRVCGEVIDDHRLAQSPATQDCAIHTG